MRYRKGFMLESPRLPMLDSPPAHPASCPSRASLSRLGVAASPPPAPLMSISPSSTPLPRHHPSSPGAVVQRGIGVDDPSPPLPSISSSPRPPVMPSPLRTVWPSDRGYEG
ncbi:hypothetical protein CPC08DRAFT_771352 [Agrocybe pediades]|nr:hypothetical protein CPC08DRAFT_771352 [Agrocybe pediades]